jgi:hypothetical protein
MHGPSPAFPDKWLDGCESIGAGNALLLYRYGEAALGSVVWLRGIVSGPVGHAATDQPVRVIAATRLTLADDGLAGQTIRAHCKRP